MEEEQEYNNKLMLMSTEDGVQLNFPMSRKGLAVAKLSSTRFQQVCELLVCAVNNLA